MFGVVSLQRVFGGKPGLTAIDITLEDCLLDLGELLVLFSTRFVFAFAFCLGFIFVRVQWFDKVCLLWLLLNLIVCFRGAVILIDVIEFVTRTHILAHGLLLLLVCCLLSTKMFLLLCM